MNTRHFFLGLVIVAASGTTATHAQVLGGGLGGGVGGAVSGGLRNADVMTGGTLNGSLDSQFERGALRRQTRDTLDRSTRQARDGVGRIKGRTESGVAEAQSRVSAATTTAAGTANALPSPQIDSAANVAGSAAANATASGMHSTGSANGALAQATQLQPSVNSLDGGVSQTPAAENFTSTVNGVDDVQPTSLSGKDKPAGVLELPNAADNGQSENGSTQNLSSGLSSGGALEGVANSESLLVEDATDNSADSGASGSASAEGTASKRRVSASGSAHGDANANVARN